VTTIPIVDIESALVAWLRADTATASLCSGRIYSALPREPTFPALRVTRVGGAPPHDRPLTHDGPLIQLDAWGGTKAQASQLVEAARSRIADAYSRDLGAGIVVGRVAWSNLSYDPDTSYSPARPRFRADALLTHHRPTA
jgi:uncharacterized protein DUF3168